MSRVGKVSFFRRRKVFKSREILFVFPTFKTAQPGKGLLLTRRWFIRRLLGFWPQKHSPVAVEYEVTL